MGMITEIPPTNSQLNATTPCDANSSTLLANSRVPVYENYCGNSDQEREHIRRQNEISLLTKQLNNSGWGRRSTALALTLVDHQEFQNFDINARCSQVILLTKKDTNNKTIDIYDLMRGLKQCFDNATNNKLAHFCFKVLKNGTVYITFNAEKSADVLMTDLLLCNPASRKEKKDNIISKYSKVNSDSLLNLYKKQKTLIQHYFPLPA